MENFNAGIWEDSIYSQGYQLNRYPYDNVISFVFRNYPRNKEKSQVKILELGCGAGNNLWFAAREGFSVTGIDGSKSAIDFVKQRFEKEGLQGEFIVGDFTALPFANEEFDLVIDRGALVCVNKTACKKAMDETWRVLHKGGKFFLNLYSDRHTSAMMSTIADDGMSEKISGGTLTGVGDLFFYSYKDIRSLIDDKKWKIEYQNHKAIESVGQYVDIHAEWEIVLTKI